MNLFEFIDNDYKYLLNMTGDDVLVNDSITSIKTLINNLKVNRETDIRTIACTTELKRGDYITWDNEKWLIISEIGHKRFSYYKGIIQKCNYDVKFNFSGIIKEIPCIINSRYFDVETGKFISTPAGKVIVTMPYNSEIGINQRFIKMGSAFKVVGKDFTKNGLSIFTCDLDAIIADDDKENEIADAKKYLYTLTITNGDTASLDVSDTLQLNVEVKLNNEIVTDKKIIYSSNNTDACTVDEQGLITAISEGTCIISAYMEDMPSMKDIIEITVQEIIEDNFTYELIGDSEIKQSSTRTYTVNKYNNGVLVEDAQFDFSIIEGNTPKSAYTFTIINDTQCKIKCNDFFYDIILRATDRADSTQYVEKEIELSSII